MPHSTACSCAHCADSSCSSLSHFHLTRSLSHFFTSRNTPAPSASQRVCTLHVASDPHRDATLSPLITLSLDLTGPHSDPIPSHSPHSPPLPFSAPAAMSTSIGHITIIKKNGKDGPIFLLEPTKRPTYTIGSADTNHIRMALPHVLPLHASISIDENSRVYLCSEAGGGSGGETFINDEVVSDRRLLADSDVFRIAGRLFRVQLGGEQEREKESKKAMHAVSTPTKALSSRENVPLAIISASPSSASHSTSTPTRKPRVSAERDTGNTGSTTGGSAAQQSHVDPHTQPQIHCGTHIHQPGCQQRTAEEQRRRQGEHVTCTSQR